MSPNIKCIEPSIYLSEAGGLSFEEGRAFLLGKYVEKELDTKLETIIREHLKSCECCTDFLKRLDDGQLSLIKDTAIIHASCPSSRNLDCYVFARGELSATEQQKIEKHIRECDLCKEEIEWLNSVGPEALPAGQVGPVPKRNWIQYASIAASLLFMGITLFLFSQRITLRNTEARLRASAVVKTPDQIDYAALQSSSISLPEKMTAVYEKGVESLKGKRFQEAIRHLEIVATAHPKHSGAIFLLGYTYYQMNEPEKAFELCDRAEAMAPQSLERCLSLVNIALKTGHFGRAIREISGLHHVAPDHPAVKETYERVTAITRGSILKL